MCFWLGVIKQGVTILLEKRKESKITILNQITSLNLSFLVYLSYTVVAFKKRNKMRSLED